MMIVKNLAVVIPMFNEEKIITQTLESLTNQSYKDFSVFIVDNASTDKSKTIAQKFIKKHRLKRWHVIDEPEKGTGAAADTGIRSAIHHGATHIARTDSDCLAPPEWTKNIVERFESGLCFISGRITSRKDEGMNPLKRVLLDGVVVLSSIFGRFRPSNYSSDMQGKYIMTAGCNLAIEAKLYVTCGGFPRSKIEEEHEDRTLVNRVRNMTTNYAYCKEVIIYCSTRRIEAWGIKNTLLWYKNHAYKPKDVDIR